MKKPPAIKTIGTILDAFLDRDTIAEAAEHSRLHHAWQEIVLEAFLGRPGRGRGGASGNGSGKPGGVNDDGVDEGAEDADFAGDAETRTRINAEKLIWHSRVRDLDRGRLVIEVDHPGWGQLLQFKQRALLAAVQRRFPALQVTAIAVILQKGTGGG